MCMRTVQNQRLGLLKVCAMAQAVSAGLSSWRAGFKPWPVHVRYVVDKVELGQDFVQVLQVSSVNIILLWLHTHIYHLRDEQ
jgi:hypothetical protein